jgi:hypothetical protein
MAATYKEFETQFDRIIKTYCYAAIDDIIKSCNETEYSDYASSRYNECYYENYKNFTISDSSSKKKLDAVFSIKCDLNILLAILFEMLCDSLKKIDVSNDDTVETIIDKFDESDCNLAKYVLGSTNNIKFGHVLTDARDNKGYFIGYLQKFVKCSSSKVLGVIGDAFNNFLKMCCMQLSEYIWYSTIGTSINSSMLFMVFFPLDFDRDSKEYLFATMNKIQETRKLNKKPSRGSRKSKKDKTEEPSKAPESASEAPKEEPVNTPTTPENAAISAPEVAVTAPSGTTDDIISNYINFKL